MTLVLYVSGQKLWLDQDNHGLSLFFTQGRLFLLFYHSSHYFIRWCGFTLVVFFLCVLHAFDSIFKSIGWLFHAHWCPFTWSPRSDVLSVNTNSKGKFMICFTRFREHCNQINYWFRDFFVVDRILLKERIWTGKFSNGLLFKIYINNIWNMRKMLIVRGFGFCFLSFFWGPPKMQLLEFIRIRR